VLLERNAAGVRSVIDEFCARIEPETSAPVVVILDGNQEDDDYIHLANYLAGKGRRCLVVGTCYAPSGRQARRDEGHFTRKAGPLLVHYYCIPVKISTDERDAFFDHIDYFLGSQVSDRIPAVGRYDNFFTLLWHVLPEKRGLAQGLVAEIDSELHKLRKEIEDAAEKAEAELAEADETTLSRALLDAVGGRMDEMLRLLDSSEPESFLEDEDGNIYKADTAIDLAHSVMIVGALGTRLPQDLALRLVRSDIAAYRGCLENLRVIRVHPEKQDFESLEPRSQLEAMIWVRRRLRDKNARLDYVRRIVLSLHPSEVQNESHPYLEFVVRLLEAARPEKGRPNQINVCSFRDIAEMYANLREQSGGVVSSRLLLQEAHAIRESVRERQNRQSQVNHQDNTLQSRIDEIEEHLALLTRAEELLETAEDQTREQYRAPDLGSLPRAATRFIGFILTEKAAVLGSKMRCQYQYLEARNRIDRSGISEVDRIFKSARNELVEARRLDETNVRVWDVACWVFSDRISFGTLDESSRIEIVEEWATVIDHLNQGEVLLMDEDLLHRRNEEFAAATGNSDVFENLLRRLAVLGSTAAHTLRARQLGKRDAWAGLQYLETSFGGSLYSGENENAFLLYYRLWWLANTGEDYFLPRKQRTCLRLLPADWQRLKALSEIRRAIEGDTTVSLFHLAWALCQLGDAPAARPLFHILERDEDSAGIRRSTSLALLTDGDGVPKSFYGSPRPDLSPGRSRLWIPELGDNIPFFPTEGDIESARSDGVLGPFHVALNFRGPILEKPSRLLAQRQQERDATHR
jgi:hypothetical protein